MQTDDKSIILGLYSRKKSLPNLLEKTVNNNP